MAPCCVEIRGGTLTRAYPDGTKAVVAELGGGPNSSAVGPDGAIYITQSGGLGAYADGFTQGSIARVDPVTGAVSTLYSSGQALDGSGELLLKAPNDLVFDSTGGFFFTDLGKSRARDMDVTGIYYAKHDGSSCREIIPKHNRCNGIGLSPDGSILYVVETTTGQLWSYEIESPGQLKMAATPASPSGRAASSKPDATLLYQAPGRYGFDSMAVDGDGNICAATLFDGPWGTGGVSVIRPDGTLHSFLHTGDDYTTNVAFGGPDHSDAYITLSRSGQLVKMPWHCKGHRCHFENTLVSANIIGKSKARL